jgi:hypothetical protein
MSPVLFAAAADPTKEQLLNWDRSLVQLVHVGALGLLLAAILLPFVVPLLLNLSWCPRWVESLFLRRYRRCVVLGLALLAVTAAAAGASPYWLPAKPWPDIPPQYFELAIKVRQQYDGLFGLRPGVAVAAQVSLALAALATAPLLGAFIAALLYKAFEWTVSLKARAARLQR